MQVSSPKTSNDFEIISKISNFNYDILRIPQFDDRFYTNIIDAPIGKGSFGSVYILDDETVFKITSPCIVNNNRIPRQQREYYKKLCTMIKNSIFYNISTNQNILILPDDVNDGVINSIINTLSAYTLHFGNLISVFISPIRAQVYTTSSRFRALSEVISKKSDLYLLFFQITQALDIAQRAIEFTHHDLHIGNILYQPVNLSYISYFDHNGTVIDILTPFISKIIDFGMSSCVYDNNYICSVGINLPVYHGGNFISGYDLLVLYGSIFVGNYFNRSYHNLLDNNEKLELIQILTGMNSDYDTIINETYSLLDGELYYRPKGVNGLYHHNFPSAQKVIEGLITILIRLGMATYNLPTQYPTNQLLQRSTHTEYLDAPPIKNYIVSNLPYDVYQTNVFTMEYHNNDMYIYIDRNAISKSGYKWKMDTGKIDVSRYLSGKTGIAINGGFFDNMNSYKSLGSYRQLLNDGTYYETYSDLSDIYREFIAFINIYNNDITFSLELETSHYSLQSGPVLIAGGRRIFTEELSETTKIINGRTTKIFKNKIVDSDDYLVHSGIGMTYVINAKRRTNDDMSDALDQKDRTVIATIGNYILLISFKNKNLLEITDLLTNISITDADGFQTQVENAVSLNSGIVSCLSWTDNGYNIFSSKYGSEYQLVGNIITLIA